MKKTLVAISILVIVFFLVPNAVAVVYDDGDTHIIDYTLNDSVWVYGDGTFVDIREGAYIKWDNYLTQGVYAEDAAIISMSGGYIYGNITATELTVTNISGGSIGELYIDGSEFYFSGASTGFVGIGSNCQASITGGSMRQLWTSGNSVTTFSGGSLSCASSTAYEISTSDNSFMTLVGTDFKINGISVGYGDSARDYAELLVYTGGSYFYGNLTGTLQGGQLLDVMFKISDSSDIVFVPEPTTLCLLAFGGLGLLRKGRMK